MPARPPQPQQKEVGKGRGGLGQLSGHRSLLAQTPKNSKSEILAIQLLRRYICQGWRREHIIVYGLLASYNLKIFRPMVCGPQ